MTKGRKVTFDYDAALELLTHSDQNYSSVASKFGVSRQTIQNIAKKRGLSSNSSYNVRRKLHSDIIDAAKKENLSPAELAEKFGVNIQVVYLGLNDGGINPSDLSKKVAIEKLKPFLYRIKNGESVRSVAKADQNLMARLYRAWGEIKENPALLDPKPKEEKNA